MAWNDGFKSFFESISSGFKNNFNHTNSSSNIDTSGGDVSGNHSLIDLNDLIDSSWAGKFVKF